MTEASVTPARRFDGVEGLAPAVGTHLGYGAWRAARGPFGGTIAHGYLTLSLVPVLVSEIFTVDGLRMAVNYGINKVRFPSPLPVGVRVRAGAELLGLEPGPTGVQLTLRVTVEREGSDKPVCVAETVSVLVPRCVSRQSARSGSSASPRTSVVPPG